MVVNIEKRVEEEAGADGGTRCSVVFVRDLPPLSVSSEEEEGLVGCNLSPGLDAREDEERVEED